MVLGGLGGCLGDGGRGVSGGLVGGLERGLRRERG